MRKTLVLLPLLFFLIGCLPKKEKMNNELLVLRQQEARLIDIPIPIDAVVFSDYVKNEGNKNSFAYKTNLNLDEIFSFYNKEMERNGWKQLFSFKFDFETCLSFEKPTSDRYCSISIKPNKNKNLVLIFSGSFSF